MDNAKIGVCGSGILGSALLRRLGAKAAGASLSGRSGARKVDLSKSAEVERFFDETPLKLCVNAAAFSDVDGCERDPQKAWASNAEAVRHLAAACSSRKIPFLHVSTNYVFDGRKAKPYEESDDTLPVSIYGVTKLAGEHFARACSAPVAVVRTSWLFGEGNAQNFVTVFRDKLKKEALVRALDDQIDAPTYVEDLVDALLKIGEKLLVAKMDGPAYKEVFQVVNAGTATRLEMARAMKEILGSPARVERMDAGELKGRLAIRPPFGAMSPARYERAFGVKLPGWRERLKEFLTRVPCAS